MSIQAKKLNYTYQIGTPLEHVALKDVSINIEDGSYTAIVGHTGSGKSTLLQHLNGLLKPTSGEISINGYTIDNTTKNKELGKLRKEVGFVFQFPEAQLFEETVLKDIAFAPKNFGKSEDEAEKIAREKAKLVALPEEVLEKSPFELSGGQMRRVAIAGILAMEPKVLVLDEPTAGLDPEGRHQMMEMFNRLHKDENLTIVLVTHQMNDVAEYADHVIVLESGKVIADSTPKELFSDPEWLKNHHLNLPQTTDFAYKLFDKLALSKHNIPLQSEELTDEILKILGGNLNE